MTGFDPLAIDAGADEADYKWLADRFRRGDRLTDSERAELHELALAFGNPRLAEQTA